MILKRFYLKCLSHGSYLLADEESREAAVIDPQRDTEAYLEALRQEEYRLKYVLETHLHADFVSGHMDLAARTGAAIVFGAQARARMDHKAVRHGEELHLGRSVLITVLETPGHTPESVCYLAKDLANPARPMQLFTGDTLFVGDVGRPDLLGASMPAEILVSELYDSLRDKLLSLPDETEVYPAHGAGSACGRNLGDAEHTTLAEQKRTNYALQPMPRAEFIRLVTEDQPEAPAYFSEDARLNREGPVFLDSVLARLLPLSPADLAAAKANGAVLIDTRGPDSFAAGSIPGAIQIGLDGQFASWLGTLVPKEKPLLILAEEGREEEAAVRCARVGYDNVVGWLEGGFEAWKRAGGPVDAYRRADAAELGDAFAHPDRTLVLDVRRIGERAADSLPGTLHIPLNHLQERIGELVAEKRPILVHCASGYRSSIAISLLRKGGIIGSRDVAGGIRRYREAFPAQAPAATEVTHA